MSYEKALEFAGAKVIAYEEFGSWQGEWIAKVVYNNQEGWVTGYFGSCSGCDAFEGEFGYKSHDCIEYGKRYYAIDSLIFCDKCQQCQSLKERFFAFGKDYLDDILTKEQMLEKAKKDLSWDLDAQKMVDFIEKDGKNEISS